MRFMVRIQELLGASKQVVTGKESGTESQVFGPAPWTKE